MTSNPVVSDAILPIYNDLIVIRDELKALKESGKIYLDTLQPLQERLDEIDSKRHEGVFGGAPNTDVPAGQAACYDVMDEAYDLVGELIAEAADMNVDVTQQYSTLCGIKRKLLRLKADRNYSLEDVHHYQLMVDAIDSKRVNGIFGGDLQNVPPGQAQCSTILHQDYELLRYLLTHAGDMNGEMRQIYGHLLSIKRKLIEIKARHVKHTSEDLHIHQVQLNAVDSARVDGVFAGSVASGKIPAGQAVCATMLEQCYKLVHDLQATATDVADS